MNGDVAASILRKIALANGGPGIGPGGIGPRDFIDCYLLDTEWTAEEVAYLNAMNDEIESAAAAALEERNRHMRGQNG